MSDKCETEAARTNALQVDDPESNFERCPGAGGIPAWKMQQDLHYITYGFGREPNTSGPTNFGDSDGPPASVNAEWRGVTRDGRFFPFAVIMRLQDPEKEDRPQTARDNPLYVFRLTEDGKSCVVDKIAPGPDQQAAALRSADRMAGPGPAPRLPTGAGGRLEPTRHRSAAAISHRPGSAAPRRGRGFDPASSLHRGRRPHRPPGPWRATAKATAIAT